MKNFITLPYKLERDPPPFETNEIKTPESLPRYFIKEFTRPGQTVFDPFAGLGTTLFVAESLKRIPYGIEADPRRHAWVAGQMDNWMNLICADSARAATLGLPRMDFSLTAPPFMAITHKWNPLYGGDSAKDGYDSYLKRMRHIYKQVNKIMKRKARIVVQVDNIPGRRFTPLIRDLSNALSKELTLENEITVAWRGGRDDYRHTTCLVFRNN
ncbi:MAG: site-specific DNA-methyltransferase [Alphaproteobacteria bacterium]|nr:site-specific DNA-methyltransferase [Alphaproteobacteria bacterium]